jgi:ubiquitin C-terminal hydrolase
VVQALFSSKHLRTHITTCEEFTQDANCLASWFKTLFTEMQENKVSRVVSLKPLFDTLKERIGGIMELFQENDAMEFITILIDELAKDYKAPYTPDGKRVCPDPSFAKLDVLMKKHWVNSHADAISAFNDITYGQFIIQVRCGKCRHTSHRGEPFISLDLGINGDTTVNMLDLLNTAFRCENISDRTCDKRCGKVPGVRSSRIWKIPKLLTINLKRFHGYQKITTPIIVPDNLDLNQYSLFCANTQYHIVAIICHVGQLQSGHYYALVKRGNIWYIVDDDMTPQPITDIQPYSRTFYVLLYDSL